MHERACSEELAAEDASIIDAWRLAKDDRRVKKSRGGEGDMVCVCVVQEAPGA